MSVADVERAVRLVMANAQEHGRWLAGNETAVRYALVDPILWALGWRTWSPLQCLPKLDLGQRGPVDYALFGPDGNVAVMVAVGTVPACRRSDRQRLMAQVRGMSRGVAVLTYGTRWEIYDLNLRAVGFSDKLTESLSVGGGMSDDLEEVAQALDFWLRQDLWWNGSECLKGVRDWPFRTLSAKRVVFYCTCGWMPERVDRVCSADCLNLVPDQSRNDRDRGDGVWSERPGC